MDSDDKDKIHTQVKLVDRKVLIVDDSASDRLIVKAILSKLGIVNIVEAESANAAIFKLENAADSKKAFDLVISDWSMPGKTGYELLRLIRNDRRLKQTLVMIITSTADANRVSEALKLGIADFVVKPIHHRVLAEKIEKILIAKEN